MTTQAEPMFNQQMVNKYIDLSMAMGAVFDPMDAVREDLHHRLWPDQDPIHGEEYQIVLAADVQMREAIIHLIAARGLIQRLYDMEPKS